MYFLQGCQTKWLIIDLKGVSYIDLYSSRMMVLLHQEYEAVDIKLVLTGVTG